MSYTVVQETSIPGRRNRANVKALRPDELLVLPESKKATAIAEAEYIRVAEAGNMIRNRSVGGYVSVGFGGWPGEIGTVYVNINMTISLVSNILRIYLAG